MKKNKDNETKLIIPIDGTTPVELKLPTHACVQILEEYNIEKGNPAHLGFVVNTNKIKRK